MKKDVIKVVKRNKTTIKSPVVITTPEFESEGQLKLVNVINNWISERSENRRTEKEFSDGKISEWKQLF